MSMEILELNPSRPSLPLRHTGWFVEWVATIGNYKEYSEHFIICLHFLLLSCFTFYESLDH